MANGPQSELIVTNPDGNEFSENAMLAVLERLRYGHVTVHGFRATFAEECTDYSPTSTNASRHLLISAALRWKSAARLWTIGRTSLPSLRSFS
jgi:hypothetical protein